MFKFKSLLHCFIASLFFLTISYKLLATSSYAADRLYFIHTDHLGSVIAMSTEDGQWIMDDGQNKYSPYGTIKHTNVVTEHCSVTTGCTTERQYTGQIADASTNLQYYNARYYDPILSRFISADSVNDQQNRYNYVGGNPVSRSDPNGTFCIKAGNIQVGECDDRVVRIRAKSRASHPWSNYQQYLSQDFGNPDPIDDPERYAARVHRCGSAHQY